MPENNNDAEFYAIIGIFATFVLILALYKICMFISDFSSELKYIKCEIGRTDGDERRYWMRKKRKLWLSLIPFVKYR